MEKPEQPTSSAMNLDMSISHKMCMWHVDDPPTEWTNPRWLPDLFVGFWCKGFLKITLLGKSFFSLHVSDWFWFWFLLSNRHTSLGVSRQWEGPWLHCLYLGLKGGHRFTHNCTLRELIPFRHCLHKEWVPELWSFSWYSPVFVRVVGLCICVSRY